MNVKTSAEKEWLRKLTTDQPKAKEEVKAPQRVTISLPWQNCRNSSRNNQIGIV